MNHVPRFAECQFCTTKITVLKNKTVILMVLLLLNILHVKSNPHAKEFMKSVNALLCTTNITVLLPAKPLF